MIGEEKADANEFHTGVFELTDNLRPEAIQEFPHDSLDVYGIVVAGYWMQIFIIEIF